MWRSPFLLLTSGLLWACSSGPAKPDAYCGTGGAPTSGIVAAGTGFSLTYGDLSASANNDCPDPMAPMGVVSLTIEEPAGSPQLFTLCVQRPDLLAGGQPLGTAVKVVDVTGSANGCTFLPDRATAPTGTVTATGICNNGTSHAGFALTIDGTIQLTRTCGSAVDSVSATLTGTVAISAP